MVQVPEVGEATTDAAHPDAVHTDAAHAAVPGPVPSVGPAPGPAVNATANLQHFENIVELAAAMLPGGKPARPPLAGASGTGNLGAGVPVAAKAASSNAVSSTAATPSTAATLTATTLTAATLTAATSTVVTTPVGAPPAAVNSAAAMTKVAATSAAVSSAGTLAAGVAAVARPIGATVAAAGTVVARSRSPVPPQPVGIPSGEVVFGGGSSSAPLATASVRWSWRWGLAASLLGAVVLGLATWTVGWWSELGTDAIAISGEEEFSQHAPEAVASTTPKAGSVQAAAVNDDEKRGVPEQAASSVPTESVPAAADKSSVAKSPPVGSDGVAAVPVQQPRTAHKPVEPPVDENPNAAAANGPSRVAAVDDPSRMPGDAGEPESDLSVQADLPPQGVENDLRPDEEVDIPSSRPAASANVRRIAPRERDVASLLSQELAGISLERVPLHRFADEMAMLCGVSISLDPEALASLGLAVDQPVSVSTGPASIQAVLKSALAPLGLAAATVHNQLQITRAATGGGLIKIRYSLDDLAGSEGSSIEVLAGLLRTHIVPGSWKENGGRGQLTVTELAIEVDQSPLVHDQILVFCEKLRVARGQPTRTRFDAAKPTTARFHPRRYDLAPRRTKAKSALSETVQASFVSPEPLSGIATVFGRQSRCVVLIDGPALAAAGLSSESAVALDAAGVPLADALARATEPLGLAWRAVDERTVEITTPVALATRPEVEFYSVKGRFAAPAQAQPWLERLRQQLGMNPSDRAAALYLDWPSQSLIVSAGQPQQAIVARWMDEGRRD